MQDISKEVLDYIQSYQKIFRQILTESRRIESDRYILASSNKSKAIWKIIDKETGKSKQTHNIIIKQGCNLIMNPRAIADSFNRYFINIVEDLAVPGNKCRTKTISQPQGQRYTAIMYAEPVTETEMEKVILSLNTKASAGCDDIPMTVVKHCMIYIIKPLVHIRNVSFQHGIFPDQMKTAKIKPLYKNGDKHEIKNYRPISILPAFSKNIGKINVQ